MQHLEMDFSLSQQGSFEIPGKATPSPSRTNLDVHPCKMDVGIAEV